MTVIAVIQSYVMKTLTIRLPEPLWAEIEAESRGRRISKSDVVRERLELAPRERQDRNASLQAIADLVGSVDGLPADVSAPAWHARSQRSPEASRPARLF
jgi:Arc/MetJ-type ribon-helix-helix transcriptional regulator